MLALSHTYPATGLEPIPIVGTGIYEAGPGAVFYSLLVLQPLRLNLAGTTGLSSTWGQLSPIPAGIVLPFGGADVRYLQLLEGEALSRYT